MARNSNSSPHYSQQITEFSEIGKYGPSFHSSGCSRSSSLITLDYRRGTTTLRDGTKCCRCLKSRTAVNLRQKTQKFCKPTRNSLCPFEIIPETCATDPSENTLLLYGPQNFNVIIIQFAICFVIVSHISIFHYHC